MLSVLPLLLISGAFAVPAAYSPRYHFTGTFRLPYAGLIENFEVWTNGTEQRINWYGGLDVDIATPQVSYQTFPVYTGSINRQWCLQFGGGAPVPLLVNMSEANGWKLINSTSEQNHYQKVVKNEERESTYDFYSAAKDGTPQQLHMLGYDFVLGSHYDEYIIEYKGVTLGPKSTENATRFAPPGPDCGGYPPMDPRRGGPGDSGDWRSRRVASPLSTVRASLEEAAGSGSNQPPAGWPDCSSPDALALAGGDSEPIECAYERWAAEHGRDLAGMTAQERARRLSRFRRSHRVVTSHNRKSRAAAAASSPSPSSSSSSSSPSSTAGASFEVRLTHLADWTEVELATLRGTTSPAKARPPTVPAAGVHPPPTAEELASLPTKVDWTIIPGVVLPVQDQATCGSCWSFGTMGTIAGSQAIKHGSLTQMSHQSAMDCTWAEGNYGCDGGNDFLAYSWFLANGNGSIPTETTYGNYLGQDGRCHYYNSSVKMGAQITAYYNVTSGSETALMSAVAQRGPISISIDAALETFDFYSSGVYDDPACKSGLDDLDHTVLLVGYGTSQSGQDYWKVKNSWSTHWGDEGYVLIARKGNICGVATQPTYVDVA